MFSFLNSGFLFLASAVILPILIYLFAKKKPNKIVFSTIRFIKKSQQRQRKRVNIKNILLLIIRILIILFVILAISRPSVKLKFLNKGTQHPKTAIAIIVDNSYSMNYLVDTKTNMEKSKEIVRQVNKILNDTDVSYIMTLDKSWNQMHSYINYGKFSSETIDNLQISSITMPMNEAIAKAEKKLQEAHITNKEIYIVTDLQQNELPKILKIPTFIIPTSIVRNRNNISCQNANVKNEIINQNLKKVIEFELVNHSDQHQHDVIYQIFMDGNTIAEQATDLLPKQRKKLNFSVDAKQPGWHSGYIYVKNERLIYDNKSYFSFLEVLDPKVVILSDNNILPVALNTVLDIYTSDISFITSENTTFDELVTFDNIIVYKKKELTEKFKFILSKLTENDHKVLYVMGEGISVEWQNFFYKSYLTKFHKYDNSVRTIDNINSYHPITKLLSDKENITCKGLWLTESKTNILLQTDQYPVAIENNGSLLWLFNISNKQNPFTFNSSYPVFAYNCLQYSGDKQSRNFKVGSKLVLKSPELILPNEQKIVTKQNYYFPKIAGLYHQNNYIFAVNLDYAESNFSKMEQTKKKNLYFCSENWQNEILQSRYGFELWKYLLIIVILLVALEMFIIKREEHKQSS